MILSHLTCTAWVQWGCRQFTVRSECCFVSCVCVFCSQHTLRLLSKGPAQPGLRASCPCAVASSPCLCFPWEINSVGGIVGASWGAFCLSLACCQRCPCRCYLKVSGRFLLWGQVLSALHLHPCRVLCFVCLLKTCSPKDLGLSFKGLQILKTPRETLWEKFSCGFLKIDRGL